MIVNQTYEIFFPMLVGGVIIAPLVWIITYYTIYSFIASFKKRRNKKISPQVLLMLIQLLITL